MQVMKQSGRGHQSFLRALCVLVVVAFVVPFACGVDEAGPSSSAPTAESPPGAPPPDAGPSPARGLPSYEELQRMSPDELVEQWRKNGGREVRAHLADRMYLNHFQGPGSHEAILAAARRWRTLPGMSKAQIDSLSRSLHLRREGPQSMLTAMLGGRRGKDTWEALRRAHGALAQQGHAQGQRNALPSYEEIQSMSAEQLFQHWRNDGNRGIKSHLLDQLYMNHFRGLSHDEMLATVRGWKESAGLSKRAKDGLVNSLKRRRDGGPRMERIMDRKRTRESWDGLVLADDALARAGERKAVLGTLIRQGESLSQPVLRRARWNIYSVWNNAKRRRQGQSRRAAGKAGSAQSSPTTSTPSHSVPSTSGAATTSSGSHAPEDDDDETRGPHPGELPRWGKKARRDQRVPVR